MENSLAPGLKIIVFTVVSDVTEMSVIFETSKVAVSVGTMAGVQFSAVFQSLFTGFKFHVALSAWSV